MVKLFDFGIASNDRAALKLTAPGTAFGTPEYIAPEQAMGQKVDARADVYGVGVVLFEMATGRLPFQSEDNLGYLRAHIKQLPPAPSAVAPDAELSRAVERSSRARCKKTPRRASRPPRRWSPPSTRPPATGRSRSSSAPAHSESPAAAARS